MIQWFAIISWTLLLGLSACASRPSVPASLKDPVAKVRGLDFKGSVVQVTKSRSEIRDYLVQRLEEEFSDEELKHEEAVLRLFGLIPDDYDYKECVLSFLTQEIGGYYDPKAKHLVLPAGEKAPWQRGVIYHELTHALQDQHFDLEPMLSRKRGNDDQILAQQALIEGEAMLVMAEALSRTGDLDGQSEINIGGEGFSQACALPDALQKSLLFPYQEGLWFVLQRRQQGGWSAINEHHKNLPQSTEQILHPQAWGQPENTPILISEDRLPSSFDWVSTHVMGEFGWSLILGKKAAKGWGGDRYWLSLSEKGAIQFSTITTWDREEDATEFFEAWQNKFADKPFMRISQNGQDVLASAHLTDLQWARFQEAMKRSDP